MSKRANRRLRGKKATGHAAPSAAESLGTIHAFQTRDARYMIPSTLLRNLVGRDLLPVQQSFDKHFGAMLEPIDEVFSDAGVLCTMATKAGLDDMDKDYADALVGLTYNTLGTIGAATLLLRSGLKSQSMVLLRQAVEMRATIIHIVGDDSKKALKEFAAGTYKSTGAIGQAKKAVPAIGLFWGC